MSNPSTGELLGNAFSEAFSPKPVTVEMVMDEVTTAILKTAKPKTDHERIMGLMGDLSKLDKMTIDEIRNDLLHEIENREPVCAECESSDVYRYWDGDWSWCNECQEDVSVVIL